MTPKEKAKELFDKYQIAGSQWYVDRTKNYALIAVGEILDMVKHTPIEDIENEYWEQVKQEIEKL